MEYYAIYDNTTGLIDGGTGLIDRAADQKAIDAGDQSVMLWHIENRILKKNRDRRVVYLKQPLDPEKQRVDLKTLAAVSR